MEKLFKLKDHGTTVRTEITAGITTFLAMAYILVVNPSILSESGMDWGSVFTATALSAAIATLVMAFVANLPYALAPGMGLNAFLTYTVCFGMGKSWQFALTAVFVEGIIFLILTAFNIREAIVNSIPKNLKSAITVGIGMFIAFIGFKNAGFIVADGATFVTLGEVKSTGVLLFIIAFVLMAVLTAYKVKGALLIGILAATVLGIPMGITNLASLKSGTWLPPSLAPTFWKFEFSSIFTVDFLVVVFTFLFVDMFDTVGTLIGCATKAGMIQEDGTIPNCKEALFADAVGTTVGAILGTSTVTTFVESSAGVMEGGRTGLTALTVAVFFLLSLFLSPIFLLIPGQATAAALVMVGFFMLSPVKDIDTDDPTEGIPAFLTILTMVLTYSISDGIMFGILSYTILKLCKREWKAFTPTTIVVAVLFLLKIIIG